MKKCELFKGTQFYGSLNYIGASILNLDCDIIDLAMINAIEDISSLRFTEKDLHEGQFVFKLKWQFLPKRLPFLPCKSRSSIFSRLEKLEKLCLIERVDKKSNEMWFKWGSRFDDFKNAKDLEVEENEQISESGTVDSEKSRVRHGGRSESGTVDAGESGLVDSIISIDNTSLEFTFESGHKSAPPEKNDSVNTEKEIERKKVPPKKEMEPEELQTFSGLKKAMRTILEDTPANRIQALKFYEVHILGDYFMSSWEYLSDGMPISPQRVIKEWIMKGGWYQITECQYNKIGNWIKTEFKILNEKNEKSGPIDANDQFEIFQRRQAKYR